MNAHSAHDSIAITGRALVSALGTDVVMACAAARAGIARPSALEHFKGGGSSQQRGGIPLSAHEAAGITHGFIGNIRLLRMLTAAFKALRTECAIETLKASRVGVYLCYPDPLRVWTGAAAVVDDDERKERLEEASKAPQADALGTGAELVRYAADIAELPQTLSLRAVETSGHAGVAAAMGAAKEALLAGQIDLALVVAADSLLDVDTLLWLEATGRLRTQERAAGLIPGEACGVLVLQRARAAAESGSQIYGTVEHITSAHDEQHLLSGGMSTGAVTAQLLRHARGAAADEPMWILSDHNGESSRASEWGNALFHLARIAGPDVEPVVWFPAVSFGETAAASAIVAVCIATSAWARGYHPAKRAIISSISDGPARSAITLARHA